MCIPYSVCILTLIKYEYYIFVHFDVFIYMYIPTRVKLVYKSLFRYICVLFNKQFYGGETINFVSNFP